MPSPTSVCIESLRRQQLAALKNEIEITKYNLEKKRVDDKKVFYDRVASYTHQIHRRSNGGRSLRSRPSTIRYVQCFVCPVVLTSHPVRRGKGCGKKEQRPRTLQSWRVYASHTTRFVHG